MKEYPNVLMTQVAEELEQCDDCDSIEYLLFDYSVVREQLRACK